MPVKEPRKRPAARKAATPCLSPKALSALSEMADDETRTAFLRTSKLFHEAAVLELNAAAQKELRVNTKSALAIAQAAVLVAQKLPDATLLAQSYRIKANVLAASGAYQEATQLYDSAIAIFEKAQQGEGLALTYTASIQPHIMLGVYDQAFAAAEKAKTILTALGDDLRLARLENNIGNIYHRQDRFEEALRHYEFAYQKLLPYGDVELLTISLNNMSMCLMNLNDFARSLSSYTQAKEFLKERDLPLIHLITDYNIAYLYYMRGDYYRAIAMLKAAGVAGEQIGYTYLVALTYLDLSDIYVELNLSSEAQDAAENGYLLFQKLQIGYEAAKTLTNRAIVLGQEGKMRRSLELFAQAKPLFVKENNIVWPWLIDIYQAVVLFREGRYYEARRLGLGAVSFFDGSGLKNKAALCHFLLAQIALRTGEPEAAHDECFRALQMLENVDAPILRYQGHFLLGQIEQARGDLPAAYREYQNARNELESLRSNLGREELKISFMKNKTELYERLVELCLDEAFPGNSREEAFRYMELAKSRSFTEMIFQRTNASFELHGGQSDLVLKIRDMRGELNWYQHRIELEQLRPEANSPERIKRLHAEAQEREKALLAVLNEYSSTGVRSEFSPLPAQIPLESIQELLSDDTCLLEYYFAGDAILAAVLTRDKLELQSVCTVSQVSQTLGLLRFQLGKVQASSANGTVLDSKMDRATVAHLQELYNLLIRPVRSRLTQPRLVIVPHGNLHYLPFQALLDGEDFLLDSYTVSYAPSSTLFGLCHVPTAKPGVGSLVLGVPDERAPFIKDEAEAIHNILPDSEIFVGESANHATFVKKAPSRRFIHVATHGIFRPDNPMFSGIRLSDGYLHLYELFHMQFSAELLTLSGCATGLNVVAAGDELLGMVRGLLFAGARALQLSLWDVNDRCTAQFMIAFYQALNRSLNPAEALRQAALQVRAEHPHPYFWAPFVLVGKGLTRELRQVEKNCH